MTEAFEDFTTFPAVINFERLPPRVQHLVSLNRCSTQDALEHNWSNDGISPNCMTTHNGFGFFRGAGSFSTDAVRSKQAYSRGIHAFEIFFDMMLFGTHATIGVGTKAAPLTCAGFRTLIGEDDQSWGWDIQQRQLVHVSAQEDQNVLRTFPNDSDTPFSRLWTVPDDGISSRFDQTIKNLQYVILILDCDKRTMSFIIDGVYLDAVMKLSPSKDDKTVGDPLHIMASTVSGNVSIVMRRICGFGDMDHIPSLMRLVGTSISQQLEFQEQSLQLPVPQLMQTFIAQHLSTDSECQKREVRLRRVRLHIIAMALLTRLLDDEFEEVLFGADELHLLRVTLRAPPSTYAANTRPRIPQDLNIAQKELYAMLFFWWPTKVKSHFRSLTGIDLEAKSTTYQIDREELRRLPLQTLDMDCQKFEQFLETNANPEDDERMDILAEGDGALSMDADDISAVLIFD